MSILDKDPMDNGFITIPDELLMLLRVVLGILCIEVISVLCEFPK